MFHYLSRIGRIASGSWEIERDYMSGQLRLSCKGWVATPQALFDAHW